MSKIVEPGDVYIKRLEISNKARNATLNPMDQLLGVDIWEDMTKPTMYATFMFSDNIDMIGKFPIIGEETITVEIQTPGINKPTKFVFRSFEVTNLQKDPNGKGMTYVVRCVSVEHMYNSSQLIKESMDDITSNMVPNILNHYLNSTKPFVADTAKGIQKIAFPKMNPLQAIDMLRQRSVSKEYPASAYVFFENQSGFSFKTIEGIIKDNKPNIGSRVFNAQQNVMGSKDAQADAFRTILDYQVLGKGDGNLKTAMGVFKAVTKSFDMNTKEFGSIDFNLKQVFGKFQTPSTGNKAQIPNSDSFIADFGSGIPKQYFTPKDTTRPDTFIDTSIAIRNSFAVMMNSDMTRVMIHGDTGLKVGDLVTLNLPEASGTTEKKKNDKMTSGNYLIVRLRHMVTPSTKSKHKIVFDCVKMGI